jgi:RNA polymerase sigma factor (sigma-70 family)
MTTEMDGLIVAAQAGSEDALLDLLQVCKPQLRRYASRQCASDDVEEAVQDALWLLYRRVGALRTIGAFSAWLFQIVRRECHRRARKRQNRAECDECDVSALIDHRRIDQELRIDVMRAISELPQTYREILILRDITGFSSEEAASRLNIPIAAAKSRLHRARQMVRSRIQDRSPTTESQPRDERKEPLWSSGTGQ